MSDIRTVTSQAVHDALALRGLEDGGGGYIRTSTPVAYMGAERLRLAREVVRQLPAGALVTSIEQLVEKMLPVVSRLCQSGPGGGEAEQPLQFRS